LQTDSRLFRLRAIHADSLQAFDKF
jgi:hypothetical protein